MEEIRSNKIVKCDVCHKSYKLRSDLVRYERTHSGEKQFQCICNKSFVVHRRIQTF